MTGLFSETEMMAAAAELRRQTDAMEGRRYIVVADMRGMKTVHPAIARHMGEAIRYQRERGCVLCVHVSDDTVQRLQARSHDRAALVFLDAQHRGMLLIRRLAPLEAADAQR